MNIEKKNDNVWMHRSTADENETEYIEADHSKMSAKFIRTPNLGDVPYPVIMEPNLVIEYYAQN